MFCPECGKEIPENAQFCPYCGTAKRSQEQKEVESKKEVQLENEEKKQVAKKEQKVKKHRLRKILVFVFIPVMLLAAGVLAVLWHFSPEQQILKALEEENYEKVYEIYQDNENLDQENLISVLSEKLSDIKTKYDNEEIEFEVAEMEINAIEKLRVSELKKSVADLRSYMKILNESRIAFRTAEAHMSAKQYAEAISEYRKVEEEDKKNFETAKTKLAEAVNSYRESVLTKVASCEGEQKYDTGIALVEEALFVLNEDVELTEKLNVLKVAKLEKHKADILVDAKSYADAADWVHAIQIVQLGLNEVGSDAMLEGAWNEYKNLYLAEVEGVVNGYLAEKQYDEAMSAVSAAKTVLANEERLLALEAQIEDRKPVNITEVPIFDSDSEWEYWNDGTPIDTFGNSYSDAENYIIIEQYWGAEEFVEYRVYENYDTLSGKIAAYEDTGRSGTSKLQVYADDILVYTSPTVTQKTDLFEFEVSIAGADYIKLVVTLKDGGEMILSDVFLNKE